METATSQISKKLEKEENISQRYGLINYKKFLEIRGEYQMKWYLASKPLNTSEGDEIRVLLPHPTEPPQLQPT